jgi:glycosyltransferase involved in cell wall biosynthesis
MSGTLLIVVTEDWYFCSHRLTLARAARASGLRIVVATRVQDHGECIRDAGLDVVPLDLRRRNRNLLWEPISIWRLVRLYRRVRPDLVHHVAMKPVVLGSLAARLAGVPSTVNAIAGLGYAMSSRRAKAMVLRPAMRAALHVLLDHGRSVTIVQNRDDETALLRAGMVARERLALIKGAGVDTRQFTPSPEPSDPITVTLVSRMLWDKGVGEFTEAARILGERGHRLRTVLVGVPDRDSPLAIPEQQLRAWADAGDVEWWGQRDDIPEVWHQSHIAALPSYYGEGVPKSLIEAAASGRPIVATDMPGCREIVQDGENGLLVPPRDPYGLANAIERLIKDPELRLRMGRSGRQRVLDEFSEQHVIDQTLELYRRLLASSGHVASQSGVRS